MTEAEAEERATLKEMLKATRRSLDEAEEEHARCEEKSADHAARLRRVIDVLLHE